MPLVGRLTALRATWRVSFSLIEAGSVLLPAQFFFSVLEMPWGGTWAADAKPYACSMKRGRVLVLQKAANQALCEGLQDLPGAPFFCRGSNINTLCLQHKEGACAGLTEGSKLSTVEAGI